MTTEARGSQGQSPETKPSLVEQFGTSLGEALFSYAYQQPETPEELENNRERFASQVLVTISKGSINDWQVKGLIALLKAIEAKTEPVAK